MGKMIAIEQVEHLIADAVQKAVAEATAPLIASLMQAKGTIRALQAQIYGVRTETSQVILTAEGQQFIDATWGMVKTDVTPPPAAPTTEMAVRRPRDRRGLAQRFPQLPITEIDAPLPPEIAEQVVAGTLTASRSGTYHDELVVPDAKPFLRRVHTIALSKPIANAPMLMQITPDRIVPNGDLADETIHRFAMFKFLDAIPFHRQITALARNGVDVPKQTINDALNAWGDLMKPLAKTIRTQILTAAVVHADASWQRLQAEKSCDRVHLWTALDGHQVAYLVTDDLKSQSATEVIPPAFSGRLVTDAWKGWFSLPLGNRLALCNAHARRPFAAWLKRTPNDPDATRIVAHYAALARCERDAADGPDDELLERRQRIRNERSRDIMNAIRADAERLTRIHHYHHPLADGARYILDYWDHLTRFLDHPELPTDNNAAENALRINALIRTNSLFVGSRAAADRDATALTILHSCRLQRIEPACYLARITPAMLLHRRGRVQDLAKLTPRALAKTM